MLERYWRLLFHMRVHQVFHRRADAGRIGPSEVRRRIRQLGAVEFDEIRNVLRQEHLLLPPYDDATVYEEFAALYLELRHFAPGLLASYFPALESLEQVDRVVAQDVNAEELFLAVWLPGAPDPADSARQPMPASTSADLYDFGEADWEPAHREGAPEMAVAHRAQPSAGPSRIRRHRSEKRYFHWMARAERAATAGNLAGAAIRRARAAFWAPRERATVVATALRNDVHRLVARLQAALDARDQDPRPWRESLLALAHQAPRGLWTVESRLLYDLQKVCVDHERGIYTVDVVEWVLSLGKRPIKRSLPSQREVLMSKHLRSAARRLPAIRISDRQRRQLSDILRTGMERTEAQLREHFRPLIARTLEDVDLRPRHLPERVAKKKLVEELVDRIIERGFLTLGDLRDAMSRNNLKQPDCADPLDFLHGDALLRADHRLAVALDGVYQRGEVYLRWMQRFSLLAFGTKTGRFLTRYLAVPFGGAYLILAGLDHLVELLAGRDVDIKTTTSVLTLGVLLLGLLHVERFRRRMWEVVKAVGRLLRLVLIDSVRWVLRLPLVRLILDSRWTLFAFRLLVKPLVPTIIIWRVLPPEASRWDMAATIAAIFLALNFAINSRWGRNFEEAVIDGIVEGWHRFGLRILTGMFWWVMDVFRRLLQQFEKLLYTVDEWLRFKAGQSPVALVAKAALGVVWFFVTYVVRFCVNLLIEPQINPIKHFPVVTVSHKLLIGFLVPFQKFLALTMDPATASAVATIVIFGTPGIFGFLVWELKENWRLYAANRPKGLGPVHIGQHGESMVRLLKPGFHSGTVPKRFAKLRRAQRHALVDGDSKAARKHWQALQHVELFLRRYIEREFVELFVESYGWQAALPSVDEIHVATNRIRVAIRLPGISESPLWVTFDCVAGWTLAGASGEKCTAALLPQQHHVLRTGLIGLYKTGGVELVRQQIDAAFPPPTPPYDLIARGVIVWPDEPMDGAVLYDLHDGLQIVAQVLDGFPRRWLPTLDRAQLVFRDVPVAWEQWVAAWEADRLGDTADRSSAAGDFWPNVPVI